MTRTGSETRNRPFIIPVRVSKQERDDVRAKASGAGISVGALFRQAALNVAPPRAVRRPPVELEAAARVLAALGKIGSNINQLAHYAHQGKFQSEEIDDAARDLKELRIAILKAMGQE